MSKPTRSAERPAGAEGVPSAWFDTAYETRPPWDIGYPQVEVGRLLAEGKIHGQVLDIGCGTGENSMLIARTGALVTGYDIARAAVDQATHKAQLRRATGVSFHVQSVLELHDEKRFHYALDMGVFHVFSDADRPRYVERVARALLPGGSLAIVCFSEHQPGGGPRRVRQEELRATLNGAFHIQDIRAARYETESGFAFAWLVEATLR
jgi:2-polyprenyl-3-methyl-5-hydroxy-6-metoxy-1,4-benzoquinol methylase